MKKNCVDVFEVKCKFWPHFVSHINSKLVLNVLFGASFSFIDLKRKNVVENFYLQSSFPHWKCYNGLKWFDIKDKEPFKTFVSDARTFRKKMGKCFWFSGKKHGRNGVFKKVLICVQHWNVRVFISLFVELVQKSNLVRRKTANRKIFKLYLLSSRNSFFLQQFWWSASHLTVCKDQVKQIVLNNESEERM
jgi:hypothetical protein